MRIRQALQEHELLLADYRLDMLANWQGRVQTDHRLLKQDDVFVCIKGESFDGHSVIDTALKMGAVCIVSQNQPSGFYPAFWVKDTRKAAAVIARIVMLPERLPYTLIGITGTNGKTTTSLIIYQALRNLGFKCGWIGTLGYYIEDDQYQTKHTTPDIVQLNGIFAQMVQRGCRYVVMEVSSHALSLDRVYGVQFDYCLFSNLTRDHLDFHGDMSSYAEAKYSFFNTAVINGATSVINVEDSFGREIVERLRSAQAKCLSVGFGEADYRIEAVNNTLFGSSFELAVKASIANSAIRMQIASRLIGRFNIFNLALMVTTLHSLGFVPQDIEKATLCINPVKGRLESIDNPHGIGVYVDYAHTPDAVENLLKSVSELPHQRILCLLGAGGDRDRGKRPLMLRSALNYSDAVIVTDDNPRNENPDKIIKDIVENCDLRLPWWIIRDRWEAIEAILRLALPGDIVLLCGKGHEDYQEIEGVRHYFSDAERASSVLKNWTSELEKAPDELVLPLDETMLNILFRPGWNPDEKGYRPPKSFRFLSTDSRSLKSNSLFVALKGENFDGHSYLDAVLKDSANFALSEIECSATGIYKTENNVQAMSLICSKYLQMFASKRIAITGSTGKTTTKELLAGILQNSAPILKTLANENNQIGVCKTILRILPKHVYSVFELGTNHFGEIAAMAETMNPDYAIILNIGPSHLEFFGDEDGVFKEKTDLFKRPLAVRLYPGDDSRFASFSQAGLGIGFSENCDYQIVDNKLYSDGQSFTMAGREWTLPYGAPHYTINAAFAVAMARELHLDDELIQKGLSFPLQLGLRMKIENRGTGLLLLDCYNANPDSMQNALEYWKSIHPEKAHIAILGDMLELGESSIMYHSMIGAMLSEMQGVSLITVGNFSSQFHGADSQIINHFGTAEELVHSGLLSGLSMDAVILVKASHGIHLERIIPSLGGRI
jgi:UDP-N-acetylmuramyl-tripeptide synthetase/UDP-N-acetylmuramoyl-tripeptide--D-alanyl-D-alanine ligase